MRDAQLTEAEAVSHVLNRHLDQFFDTVEVETEAPKGSFLMVAKCPQTGKLLGAPTHHSYQRNLREHHARHCPNVPFDAFKGRLEMVREQEQIDAWLKSMSTRSEYAPKDRKEGEPERLEERAGLEPERLRGVADRAADAAREPHAERVRGVFSSLFEAGFPIASEGDFESVSAIAKIVKNATVAGLARAAFKDIDRCAEAIKPAARRRIHTFLSTSPVHMKYKLQKEPHEVYEMVIAQVTRARNYTDDVEWSSEDGTRTEHDFLCRCVEAAIKAGKRSFKEAGLDKAYCGNPAGATVEEGRRMFPEGSKFPIEAVRQAISASRVWIHSS